LRSLGGRGGGAVCSRVRNAAAWGRGSVRAGGCGRGDGRAGGSRVVRDRCLNFLRAIPYIPPNHVRADSCVRSFLDSVPAPHRTSMSISLATKWASMAVVSVAMVFGCIPLPASATARVQDPKVVSSADAAVTLMRASEFARRWALEAEERMMAAQREMAQATVAIKTNSDVAEWVAGSDWRVAESWCTRWADEANSWAAAQRKTESTMQNTSSRAESQLRDEQWQEHDFDVVSTLAISAADHAKALRRTPKSEEERADVQRQGWYVMTLLEAEAQAWAATHVAAQAKTAEMRGRVACRQGVALAETLVTWEAIATWAAAPERVGEARAVAKAAADELVEARDTEGEASQSVQQAKQRVPAAQTKVKATKRNLDEATAAYEKEPNSARLPVLAREMDSARREWADAVEDLKELGEELADGEKVAAKAKVALAAAESKDEAAKKDAAGAVAAIASLQAEVKKALAAELEEIERARHAAAADAAKQKAEAEVMHRAAAKWEAEAKAVARSVVGG